jgi:NAD(P)H-flavin reductase
VGTRTAVFRIKPDDVPVPEFTPGEFVIIGLAGDTDAAQLEELVRRPYSIASPAGERDHVELFVSRTGDGELTNRLSGLPSTNNRNMANARIAIRCGSYSDTRVITRTLADRELGSSSRKSSRVRPQPISSFDGGQRALQA